MTAPVVGVLSVLLMLIGGCASSRTGEDVAAVPVFRVLTLNLHHGMGTGAGEEGSNEAAFRERLDAVAALLRRESIDVAAFQEADAPTSSTGDFDHVAAVAAASGLGEVHHGIHRNRPGPGGRIRRYGTALVARWPLTHRDGGRFSGVPAEDKGYVVATFEWEGREIDVVSVHLHWLLSPIRQNQARGLAGELAARGRPLVLLGDLNCSWAVPEKTLRELAAALGLETHRPEDETIFTFPAGRPSRRLDWILVSPELEIRAHRVLPDLVSDHRAVMAEIAWREP
jgi:endonuclease/exonuclease/phosphatase family metal-dependent hydrolase